MKYELHWPPEGRQAHVNVWLDELPEEFVFEVAPPSALATASINAPSRVIAISHKFDWNNNQAALIGGDFMADKEERLAICLPMHFAADVPLSEAAVGFRPGLPREFLESVQRGLLEEQGRPSGVLKLRAVGHDVVGSSSISFMALAQSLIRLLCHPNLTDQTIRELDWWAYPTRR